jgi:hypothetical protein
MRTITRAEYINEEEHMQLVDLRPMEFTEAQPDNPITLLDIPVARLQVVQMGDSIEDLWPDRGTVEPTLAYNADGLCVLSIRRQGEYGKFEMLYIGSEIILADPALGLCVVLVAYHGTECHGSKRNRHVSKGQFYRYYQQGVCGDWEQVVWQNLTDELRSLIIETVEEKGPAWAKKPGKLSSERNPPTKPITMTSYKVVRLIEGRYYSLYDPTQEYVIGERLKEPAKPNHGGGFFSFPKQATAEFYLASCVAAIPFHWEIVTPALALLECEVGGRIISYGHKMASAYLRPIKVLEVRRLDSGNS